MEPIKVAIADDHQIFRKGVILSLRSYTNIRFVAEAQNGEELLQKIAEEEPDIVLCDLKMPVKDGIDTTRQIVKDFPKVRVIILTMYEDERFVGHLMDCGAAGYLLKSTEPAEIRKALMEVMRTGFYLNPFVNRVLIKKNYSKQKFNPSLTSEVVTAIGKKKYSRLCAWNTRLRKSPKKWISAPVR